MRGTARRREAAIENPKSTPIRLGSYVSRAEAEMRAMTSADVRASAARSGIAKITGSEKGLRHAARAAQGLGEAPVFGAWRGAVGGANAGLRSGCVAQRAGRVGAARSARAARGGARTVMGVWVATAAAPGGAPTGVRASAATRGVIGQAARAAQRLRARNAVALSLMQPTQNPK